MLCVNCCNLWWNLIDKYMLGSCICKYILVDKNRIVWLNLIELVGVVFLQDEEFG